MRFQINTVLVPVQYIYRRRDGVVVIPGGGGDKLFTRRARFGKIIEAAGRTLIGKQGEDLFLRLRSAYECHLQNKTFSPRVSPFLIQFCTVEAYFFENHCHPRSLKKRKGLPLNSRWQ